MIDVFLGITDQKEEYHSNSTDTNELKSVNETYPANSDHMAMNARRKKEHLNFIIPLISQKRIRFHFGLLHEAGFSLCDYKSQMTKTSS